MKKPSTRVSSRSSAQDLLGSFLKTHREKAGLTQKQVADHLGYSTAQFISSWERGEREPPVNVIWRLSGLYHVSAEKLFDVLLDDRQTMIETSLRAEFLAVRRKSSKRRS